MDNSSMAWHIANLSNGDAATIGSNGRSFGITRDDAFYGSIVDDHYGELSLDCKYSRIYELLDEAIKRKMSVSQVIKERGYR